MVGRRTVATLVVGAVLVAGTVTSGALALTQGLTTPTATVNAYFDALSRGDTSSVLALPGVQPVPFTASQLVLLQAGAYTAPPEVHTVSTVTDADHATVTASYGQSGREATVTYAMVKTHPGLTDVWSFATSPIGHLNLTVEHDTAVQVGDVGTVDLRSYLGAATTTFSARAVMPVFSGVTYDLYRDRTLVTAAHRKVFIGAVDAPVDVTVTVDPTAAFQAQAQKHMTKALTACLDQTVLMPTGCPFGFETSNRFIGDATWTMKEYPSKVEVLPDDTSWRVKARGVAHISGTEQSLFDGTETPVEEDITYTANAYVWVVDNGESLSYGN